MAAFGASGASGASVTTFGTDATYDPLAISAIHVTSLCCP